MGSMRRDEEMYSTTQRESELFEATVEVGGHERPCSSEFLTPVCGGLAAACNNPFVPASC